MPNEISVAFHRGSNQQMNLRENLNVLGENKEKYKTFSLPMKNDIIKTVKNGNKTTESISYKIKFVDSASFMASSLSNLVDNLTEGIHKIKWKHCDYFLEYKRVEINLIIYECLSCN